MKNLITIILTLMFPFISLAQNTKDSRIDEMSKKIEVIKQSQWLSKASINQIKKEMAIIRVQIDSANLNSKEREQLIRSNLDSMFARTNRLEKLESRINDISDALLERKTYSIIAVIALIISFASLALLIFRIKKNEDDLENIVDKEKDDIKALEVSISEQIKTFGDKFSNLKKELEEAASAIRQDNDRKLSAFTQDQDSKISELDKKHEAELSEMLKKTDHNSKELISESESGLLKKLESLKTKMEEIIKSIPPPKS